MSRVRRLYMAIRVDPPQKDAIDRIAARESEGNTSVIVRKLIDEALAARGELDVQYHD